MVDEGGTDRELAELLDAYIHAKVSFYQLEVIETETLAQLTGDDFSRIAHSRRYEDGNEPHGLDYGPCWDTRSRRQKLEANREWVDHVHRHQDLLMVLQEAREAFIDRQTDGTKKQAVQMLNHKLESSSVVLREEIAEQVSIPTDSTTNIRDVDDEFQEHREEDLIRDYIYYSLPRWAKLFAEILDANTGYVRHVLNGRTESAVTDAVKQAVLERDDGGCVVCSGVSDLRFHHIIPVTDGGTRDEDNIALLCHDCHVSAHGGTHWNIDYDSVEEFWDWVRIQRDSL